MGEREQCQYTGNECNAQNCSECDVAQEAEEYIAQCELAEQYDENGDPYRDFEGNPW